ncbi:hypothetical protein ABTM49_20720, partial [Acinetobacter baumannii]
DADGRLTEVMGELGFHVSPRRLELGDVLRVEFLDLTFLFGKLGPTQGQVKLKFFDLANAVGQAPEIFFVH